MTNRRTLKISIPHVVWRDGRPRFEPGPGLRKLGFKGRDLKDAAGRWLDLESAARFSEQLEAEAQSRRKAKRQTGRMPKRSTAMASVTPSFVTVEALFKAWFEHPSMLPTTVRKAGLTPKAEGTVHFYRKMERVIIAEAPEIHGAAAGALDKVICFNLYERLLGRRGLSTAVGVMRTLSAALSFGMRRGKVPLDVNPCSRLGMETPAPRLRVAEPAEIEHLVRAADALGRPEIGDAIILGVWTGQRQQDRLDLQDEGLLNGRRYFRQKKTGAIVAIPQAPAVTSRLAAMRQRRKQQTVQHLQLVINERDNQPWASDHYTHVFTAIVRAATWGIAISNGSSTSERVLMADRVKGKGAVHYLPGIRCQRDGEFGLEAPTQWLIKPLSSLDGLRDQDLRDTAVTWLARASCTIPEICAVTGHELESANSILKHYLARHPELADHAMAKLVAWHG